MPTEQNQINFFTNSWKTRLGWRGHAVQVSTVLRAQKKIAFPLQSINIHITQKTRWNQTYEW